MICVATQHYNPMAITAIRRGLQVAVEDAQKTCDVLLPGYSPACNTCPAKQGCRDLTRAYYYTEGLIK